MLEQNDIVTLSNDQKYVVVYKTLIDNEEYCFVINMENDEDTMICKVDSQNSLKVITDEKIVNIFLKNFANETINK